MLGFKVSGRKMTPYELFGDGKVLKKYNYMVFPYVKRGSLLDFILNVSRFSLVPVFDGTSLS